MAVLTGIGVKLKGSAGSFTYRNPKYGETIVSEKATNVTNKRTSAQQRHRVKLGNIVEMYKGIMPLINDAFENKVGRVTDYNMFVKMNMMQPAVYLTKEQVANGACVLTSYQITQGTLPAIEVTGTGYNRVTDINIGSLTISATTTVAEFSNAVVNNNESYDYGDKIAFYDCLQRINATTSIPYGKFTATSIKLEKENTAKLWDIVNQIGFASVNGYLGHGASEGDAVFAWVHSRSSNGKTLTSSQRLLENNSILANYTSDTARDAAIESYGGVHDAFLSPNSDTGQGGGGSSTNVTITAQVASGKEAMGSVKAGASAAGSTSSVTVAKNSSVALVATANTGYHFVQWQDGNTQASISVVADATATYTATFAADTPTGNVTVTLTSEDIAKGKVQINGGEQGATASATVTSGSTVTIKAISVAGYDFLKWSDNNQNYERTLTPTENVSLTAYFEEE